ncbi:diguanylate cyclase (GGDEF)-like protein [Lysobacter enzymogenes]|uniref:GGDEF domain-containing protein n=1 Tax=Lysobacter enzymogenes TaxID=69 RepID=UPI0033948358
MVWLTHRAPDIRIVAARARNWLKAEHLIARFGGDEMLVVLYGCGMADAYDLADKLRLAVTEHPLAIDKVKLRVSLSMGVSELQEGDTVQSLLQKADVALYQSKAGGRSRVTGYVAEVSRIASSGAEVNP